MFRSQNPFTFDKSAVLSNIFGNKNVSELNFKKPENFLPCAFCFRDSDKKIIIDKTTLALHRVVVKLGSYFSPCSLAVTAEQNLNVQFYKLKIYIFI